MKKTFLALLIAFISLTGCSKLNYVNVREPYREAFEAACTMLIDGEENATGVLLESGYVVSAAHIFDTNGNGTIDYDEMDDEEFGVKVYGDKTRREYKAIIIGKGDNYVQNLNDIVFLQLIGENLPKSNVRLATSAEISAMQIGDPVFSVGRANGHTHHLTTGVLSTNATSGRMRMTAEIIYGNSGGGIYHAETGKLIGIATNICIRDEMTASYVSVPHLNEKGQLLGWITVPVYMPYRYPVGSWGEFISSRKIRSMIAEQGIYRVLGRPSKSVSQLELMISFGLMLMAAGMAWAQARNL